MAVPGSKETASANEISHTQSDCAFRPQSDNGFAVIWTLVVSTSFVIPGPIEKGVTNCSLYFDWKFEFGCLDYWFRKLYQFSKIVPNGLCFCTRKGVEDTRYLWQKCCVFVILSGEGQSHLNGLSASVEERSS